MRRTVPLFATIVVAALALTACTNSGDNPSADDWQNSPLNKYLAAAWGGDLSQEEQERRMNDQQKQAEDLVAACMSEQGFDYTPVDYSGMTSYSTGDEWKPDSREWVAQWGYGAIDWPGKAEMEAEPVPDQEFVDPNQEYRESLSESEATAYDEALYGAPVPDDAIGEDGSYEYDWEQSGCQGKAHHEVYGAQGLWDDEQFADLTAAMNKMYEDIESDPRNVELDQEWSSCMTDAGHPGFVKQWDAQQSIYDEMNSFWENGPEWDDSKSEEENSRVFEDYNAQIEKEMQPLKDTEIELALADLDCREKTDYRGKKTKIQWELEEQFIADHKAELEAFKAAAEQRG